MLDSLLGMLLARLHVTFLRFGELLHTMSLRTMTGNVRRHRDSITKEEHATHESFIQVKGLSVSLYCILHKNGQIEKSSYMPDEAETYFHLRFLSRYNRRVVNRRM